ncbi:MAG: hypothetical protein HQL90_08655 [Magnetococcales bacterium]|nr:hypothetical protein [Magnetococcales bacterium]
MNRRFSRLFILLVMAVLAFIWGRVDKEDIQKTVLAAQHFGAGTIKLFLPETKIEIQIEAQQQYFLDTSPFPLLPDPPMANWILASTDGELDSRAAYVEFLRGKHLLEQWAFTHPPRFFDLKPGVVQDSSTELKVGTEYKLGSHAWRRLENSLKRVHNGWTLLYHGLALARVRAFESALRSVDKSIAIFGRLRPQEAYQVAKAVKQRIQDWQKGDLEPLVMMPSRCGSVSSDPLELSSSLCELLICGRLHDRPALGSEAVLTGLRTVLAKIPSLVGPKLEHWLETSGTKHCLDIAVTASNDEGSQAVEKMLVVFYREHQMEKEARSLLEWLYNRMRSNAVLNSDAAGTQEGFVNYLQFFSDEIQQLDAGDEIALFSVVDLRLKDYVVKSILDLIHMSDDRRAVYHNLRQALTNLTNVAKAMVEAAQSQMAKEDLSSATDRGVPGAWAISEVKIPDNSPHAVLWVIGAELAVVNDQQLLGKRDELRRALANVDASVEAWHRSTSVSLPVSTWTGNVERLASLVIGKILTLGFPISPQLSDYQSGVRAMLLWNVLVDFNPFALKKQLATSDSQKAYDDAIEMLGHDTNIDGQFIVEIIKVSDALFKIEISDFVEFLSNVGRLTSFDVNILASLSRCGLDRWIQGPNVSQCDRGTVVHSVGILGSLVLLLTEPRVTPTEFVATVKAVETAVMAHLPPISLRERLPFDQALAELVGAFPMILHDIYRNPLLQHLSPHARNLVALLKLRFPVDGVSDLDTIVRLVTDAPGGGAWEQLLPLQAAIMVVEQHKHDAGLDHAIEALTMRTHQQAVEQIDPLTAGMLLASPLTLHGQNQSEIKTLIRTIVNKQFHGNSQLAASLLWMMLKTDRDQLRILTPAQVEEVAGFIKASIHEDVTIFTVIPSDPDFIPYLGDIVPVALTGLNQGNSLTAGFESFRGEKTESRLFHASIIVLRLHAEKLDPQDMIDQAVARYNQEQ